MDDLYEELLATVEQEAPERYDQQTSILQPGFPLPLPPKLQLPHSRRGRKESGFHKTERICLRQILKALFQHQWQKASALMTYYFQNIEETSYRRQRSSCERFWRLGTEILRHHPRSKIDDFNSFLDRMKNIGICLEHSFHLLSNGMLEDANRQLSLAESWRCKDTCATQQQMIQGYRGLLDYYTWVQKRDALTETEKYDYAAATAKQDMQSYFRQASVNLSAIIKQPGVWDPFVLSYVNLLEFYDDHDAALQMLNDYAYDNKFPPNPNAHVYLYQFLKRHQAPWRKLVKVLRWKGPIACCHGGLQAVPQVIQRTRWNCDRPDIVHACVAYLRLNLPHTGARRGSSEMPCVLDESTVGSPLLLAQKYAPGIQQHPTALFYPRRGPSSVTAIAVCEPPPGLPGSGPGLALEGRRSGAACLKGGIIRKPPAQGVGLPIVCHPNRLAVFAR
ncbi:UNVERIFIED_CONTAM: hypothetical protein FKN15_052074 [Acipenser sinensis]